MDIRRLIGTVALGMAVAVLLSGVSLAFLAWQHRSTQLALSALLVVLAAPALAVAAVLLRIGRQVELRATAAALIDALDAMDTGLRVIRMARAHAWVMVSYAVVLWVCQAGRLIDAREFVSGFTLMIIIALCAYLPWLSRQERRALERLDAGRHRLREARSAQGWFVG